MLWNREKKTYNNSNFDTVERLVSELLDVWGYPCSGGSSGRTLNSLSKLVLKESSEVIFVKLDGKVFHSFADFTAKLSSKIVNMRPRSFGNGLTIALIDEDLSWCLKSILALLGHRLFKIFHRRISIDLSLRLWSDIIPRVRSLSQ